MASSGRGYLLAWVTCSPHVHAAPFRHATSHHAMARARSRVRYARSLDDHILPTLGEWYVDAITPDACVEWRDGAAAKTGRALCGGHFAARSLQVDHRVPYEIAGESYGEPDKAEFMLVCGSCNRAKSWSCENCPNRSTKKIETCQTCSWASPTNYTHVATEAKRRLDLVWEGETEVAEYDALAAEGDVRIGVKKAVRQRQKT